MNVVLLAILLGRRDGLSFDSWRLRFGWRRRSSSRRSRRRFPVRDEKRKESRVSFETRRDKTTRTSRAREKERNERTHFVVADNR